MDSRAHRRATLAAAVGALAGLAWPDRPAVAARESVHQAETVNVVVPPTEGVLRMTMSTAPILLGPAVLSADSKTLELTAQLGAVTVGDARYQSQPGWSISGQVGDFRGGGPTFSGNDLGWTPVVTTQNPDRDVAVGPPVVPGTGPGLTAGSDLASAAAYRGLGTTVLGATLDLRVPAGTRLGSQSATLTITLVLRA